MRNWLIFLVLLVFPMLAFAESSSSMTLTPPATDYSVIYLENIFGVVDGVLHGTGSQMIGALFKVFNSGILVLGGIVVMYIIIVSTMLTAQDGEFLGKKWSSIWVPLRATIGLTLLIPKSSGYCMMQIFVMWVVVQGVGLADKIWAEALDYLNKGGVIIAANKDSEALLTSDGSKVADGAAKILYGQVCMVGIQNLLEIQRESYLSSKEQNTGPCYAPEPGSSMEKFCETSVPDFINSVDPAAAYEAQNPSDTYSVQMPNIDVDSVYAGLNGICGTIRWNAVDTTSLYKKDDPNTPEDESKEFSIDTLTQSDIDSINSSRSIAVEQMYSTLATAARSMVANDPEINPETSVPPEDFAAPFAVLQFGVPYQDAGALCTALDQNCQYWQADTTINSTSLLLSGTEYQDAIADYNAVMASTVNLINDAANADAANADREFITKANEAGWILAGSYFYDLIQLSGNATENMNETDTNTGLEKTVFSSKTLLEPFGEGKACVGSYAVLCEFFSGAKTKLQSVITLIDGSPDYTVTQPNVLSNPPQIPDKSITGAKTCTAYGYINDAYMVDIEGQPGLAPPELGPLPMMEYFELDYKVDSLDAGTSCSGKSYFGFKICFGYIPEVIFNEIIKPAVNGFIDLMETVANKLLWLLVYVPLNALCNIFSHGVEVIGEEGANPIVALGTMGIEYISFAMNFFFSLAFIAVPASVVPTFWALMTVCLPVYASWLTVMIGVGFMTAYYIPFLPYMMFTFGSIGWFIAVIEAMVAAPIVALGISHPEGHDALGKGEAGFMILLNIFLRPGLMIIGYIFAISLTYVGVWLINAGYQHVLDYLESPNFWGMSTDFGNWAAIFGYFFGAFVYTTMYLTIVQKAFSLIAAIPDEVLTYIGGQASNKGRETQQWAEDVKGKVEKAGESVQSGGMQAARKAGGATAKGMAEAGKLAAKAYTGGGGGGGG